MKLIRLLTALLLTTLLFTSCDKAPNGIIAESDMVDLLVDLYKADAYRDIQPMQFPDDSTLMALKQSVFAMHGVTQADYDTSLVWYAHNMDVYTDVHRRVIDRLNNELNHVDVNASPSPSANDPALAARQYYPAQGDTADIWNLPRTWLIPKGLQDGYITFDFNTASKSRPGDRYELRFKTVNGARNLSVVIAADYSDQGTALLTRNAVVAGMNKVALQTDSARQLTRIYGYINYNVPNGQVVYLDSVQLIRTHLDPAAYRPNAQVKLIERDAERRAAKDEVKPIEPMRDPTAPNTPPVVKGKFLPKEGLNKANHVRHIVTTPNSRHMPRQ